MLLILHISVVLLYAGFGSAIKQECYDAVDCVSNEYNSALYSNKREVLCRLMPDVLECTKKLNDICDDPKIKTENQESIDDLQETYDTKCIALLPPAEQQCRKDVIACQKKEFETLVRNKDDQACSLGYDVVECLEEAETKCKVAAIKAQTLTQITDVKAELKKCNGTDQQPPGGIPDAKCTKDFGACLTAEFSRSSEQKKYAEVCRLAPTVISCMEKALKHCNKARDQPQVRKLRDVLDKTQTELSAIKCACADDSSNCNNGNFVVISILHTWLALILAAILH
jgi:hypothetical protein